MRYRRNRLSARCTAAFTLTLTLIAWTHSIPQAAGEISPQRRTAIVQAVEKARRSVVNIQGQKTVGMDFETQGAGSAMRRVNGMGTGVVVDQRGYVLTNFHVVDGVRQIQVTLANNKTYVARLVCHDPKTDLALIKITPPKDLPVISIGTSSDLMVGEPVVAVGNAFGYQHTVTRGVISALGRTVQISDSQQYEDLIQTDASINPGNSGGPLLNVDGEMIGLNVAVRSGAQGIGFAIAIDAVMDVTARLLSSRQTGWHGVVVESPKSGPLRLLVRQVEQDSPAAKGGIKPGDQITAVGELQVVRPLDFQRALLEHRTGDQVHFQLRRDDGPVQVDLVLASLPKRRGAAAADDRAWKSLGLRLVPMPVEQFQRRETPYRGGLMVSEVRAGSVADQQDIRPGDILVGMHIWETVSIDNVAYVLNRPDLAELDPVKFYVVRGRDTFYGYLPVGR